MIVVCGIKMIIFLKVLLLLLLSSLLVVVVFIIFFYSLLLYRKDLIVSRDWFKKTLKSSNFLRVYNNFPQQHVCTGGEAGGKARMSALTR